MNFRFWNYAGLAAMLLVDGLVVVHAEDLARQRGTPMTNSEPKSATISSNRNQLELKASPFKNLESDLKKPFQIFDSGRSAGNSPPPSGPIAPPAAPANNRRLQELLDKRAEMMLFGPESGDSDLTKDDPLKPAEDSLDAAGGKRRTPLDRFFDMLDRERGAVTNQAPKTDLFGNNKDPDGKDPLSRLFSEHPFDGDRTAAARSVGRMSNNAADRGGFFSENLKPKTFDDLLDAQRPNDPSERSSGLKETRLDGFKRLIGGPAYTPRSNNYSPGLPVVGSSLQPALTSPWPTWSSSPPPAKPRDSFTSRAGLVGAPPELQTLPAFATTTPSLNPIPPPVLRPKQPPASFTIPKRQF